MASRISLGRKLAGMESWGAGSASGLKLSDELRSALRDLRGWIKVTIDQDELRVGGRGCGSSLDSLRSHVGDRDGAYFVVEKRPKNLLVSYLPEHASARQKMLFAASKGSLKQAIRGEVEEFSAMSKEELSTSEYARFRNTPNPLTEAEQALEEERKQETGGSYSMLARLSGNSAPPRALVGLVSGNKVPPNCAPALSARPSRTSIGSVAARFEKRGDAGSADLPLQQLLRQSELAPGQSVFNSLPPEYQGPLREIFKHGGPRNAEGNRQDGRAAEVVATLKQRRAAGELDDIDPTGLENALSDEDFKVCFGMQREEFAEKPEWKRTQLKKKVGLF